MEIKCDECSGDGWVYHSKGGQSGHTKTCPKCEGMCYELLKCKFIGIISGSSYMVVDDMDNIIGYSDTLGQIDYDINHKAFDLNNISLVEVIEVDEKAWG